MTSAPIRPALLSRRKIPSSVLAMPFYCCCLFLSTHGSWLDSGKSIEYDPESDLKRGIEDYVYSLENS